MGGAKTLHLRRILCREKTVKTVWVIVMRLEYDYIGVYVEARQLKE